MKFSLKFIIASGALLIILGTVYIVFSLTRFNNMQGIAYAASADISQVTAPMSQPGEASAKSSFPQPEALKHTLRTGRNDPYCKRQWALNRIGVLSPLEKKKSSIITVAVLDTGVDGEHEDLKGRVAGNICFSDSNTSSDINGHGTHVSGIIAATGGNSIGITGAADNVRILNVKVAEDSGMVWASNVAEGVRWAVDNGADIINMSLAAAYPSPVLHSAVEYAWDRGVLLVAAAGNHTRTVTYPAAFQHVLAVAAFDQYGMLWQDSNDGDFVDAYAPGVDIFSTLPGNDYGYCNGSSMAAAYISAFAAMAFNAVEDGSGNGMCNDEVSRLISELFCSTSLEFPEATMSFQGSLYSAH